MALNDNHVPYFAVPLNGYCHTTGSPHSLPIRHVDIIHPYANVYALKCRIAALENEVLELKRRLETHAQ